MKMILPKWLSLWWLVVIGIYASKYFMAAFIGADAALFEPAPNYPVQNIDYSVLWTAVNPIWLGRFWYSMVMTTVDLGTFLLFTRVKRIPRSYLLAYAFFTSINYMLFLEIQNVTVSMFAPLVFLIGSWAFLAIPLEKLPLGWSWPWNLSDPHVQCLARCSDGNHGLKLLFELATNGPVLLVFLIAWNDARRLKFRHDEKTCPDCQAGSCTIANPRLKAHRCEACENCACGTCPDMCGYM